MELRIHSIRPGHIFPHKDQRRVLKMPHLEELPNHHRLQNRADSPRRDDERVGGEHELVQARKRNSDTQTPGSQTH